MRTLVTGANGFIGAQLCRALRARGDAVRVLVRKSSNLKLLEGVEVEQAFGDVTDAPSVAAAVSGVDVVYHLAGIRRTPHPEDFHAVNVEGTRHVLEAAAAQPTPPRVVLAGSLSATGPSEDAPLTEDAPFRPVEPYGRSKVEAEQVCAEFAGRVPVAIGRPPRVLGPGDRENLAFVKIVQKGLLLQLTGAPRHLSMIDVDDVVEGFVQLGTHPRAAGQTFFLTAPDTLTLARLQEVAAQTLGRPIRIRIPLAPWGLRGSAWLADHISKVTGRHLPLNHKLAEQLLARGWWCSGEKAERMLGFRAKHGLEDSVARSVRWYQQHGWI
jgi:dihydroflavonol-4-reductase